VHAWLTDSGILAAEDPERNRKKRVFFRENINVETKSHGIEIRDSNVRNWRPFGDKDLVTYVTFGTARVSRCSATLVKNGR
jgi:hypothetical protein